MWPAGVLRRNCVLSGGLSGRRSGRMRRVLERLRGRPLSETATGRSAELPDILKEFQGGQGWDRWGCGVVFVGRGHGWSLIFAHYSPEQG